MLGVDQDDLLISMDKDGRSACNINQHAWNNNSRYRSHVDKQCLDTLIGVTLLTYMYRVTESLRNSGN